MLQAVLGLFVVCLVVASGLVLCWWFQGWGANEVSDPGLFKMFTAYVWIQSRGFVCTGRQTSSLDSRYSWCILAPSRVVPGTLHCC